MSGNELMLYNNPGGVATAVQIRAHVNRIQEVMAEVMKNGVHFGVIPGTPKPTLYKAGAEVLCATFHIAPTFRIEDLSTVDYARYRVVCVGVHQGTCTELWEGLGECSSNEEKYKWRKPKSPAEYDAFPEDRKRVKFERDGTAKQVRTEPADVANTILKMAAKRASVAMTLNVTAASDIFAQDIEDLPEGLDGAGDGAAAGDASVERTERLKAAVLKAANAEELKQVWQAGLAEVRGAKDSASYDALKAAVEARGKALKKTEEVPS